MDQSKTVQIFRDIEIVRESGKLLDGAVARYEEKRLEVREQSDYYNLKEKSLYRKRKVKCMPDRDSDKVEARKDREKRKMSTSWWWWERYAVRVLFDQWNKFSVWLVPENGAALCSHSLLYAPLWPCDIISQQIQQSGQTQVFFLFTDLSLFRGTKRLCPDFEKKEGKKSIGQIFQLDCAPYVERRAVRSQQLLSGSNKLRCFISFEL